MVGSAFLWENKEKVIDELKEEYKKPILATGIIYGSIILIYSGFYNLFSPV
jgi:hypothetical protein